MFRELVLKEHVKEIILTKLIRKCFDMEFNNEKSIGNVKNPSGREPSDSDTVSKNQEISLEKMAKYVCKFMDWRIIDNSLNAKEYGSKWKLIRGREEYKGSLKNLWESLDLIREVEQEAIKKIGIPKYKNQLQHLCPKDAFLADSIIRLKAIYTTLREEGEIK